MLKKVSLLYVSFIATIALAALHFLAIEFYLYWSYWWYDWMMHFFAGFVGGSATYWVLFNSGIFGYKVHNTFVSVISVLLCLMLVGIAWEIMEYAFELTDSHEIKYVYDVSHDLIADALGAILAALIGVRQKLLNRF